VEEEAERPARSRVLRWLDDRLYPDAWHWDEKLFRKWILDRLSPGDHILDVGAGSGHVPLMDFRGHAARICGIDPDERVVDNPYLDEGKVAFGEAIPYPDDSFDLAFSCSVVEHLEHPAAVFAEVRRVLKPGGRYLIKTPNFWHYMPLVASSTPLWVHRKLLRRPEEEVFPTQYKANTPKSVRRCAEAAGLSVDDIVLADGLPGYLTFSVPTYLIGWIYERAVTRIETLARFRALLIAEMRRPS